MIPSDTMLIQENTATIAPRLVPEITLHLADADRALYRAGEDELAAMGISAEVINLRTIRPLDIETVLASVRKTGRIVTIEEAFPMCSVSSEIAYQVQEKAFDYLDAPILRVTGKDVPMPYAANLEKLALPSVPEVIDAVKAVTYTA